MYDRYGRPWPTWTRPTDGTTRSKRPARERPIPTSITAISRPGPARSPLPSRRQRPRAEDCAGHHVSAKRPQYQSDSSTCTSAQRFRCARARRSVGPHNFRDEGVVALKPSRTAAESQRSRCNSTPRVSPLGPQSATPTVRQPTAATTARAEGAATNTPWAPALPVPICVTTEPASSRILRAVPETPLRAAPRLAKTDTTIDWSGWVVELTDESPGELCSPVRPSTHRGHGRHRAEKQG